MRKESAGKERTFPPPADGLYTFFLRKSLRDENSHPAQAGCGDWWGSGIFIL
ncbi:hypothetical protein [Pseudomonas sp. IT-196MI5]|uniref:hypothetical protein n=1 Tax=Pseudomonas sp. IT-196MI5 TaxID=3026440 RepID=UPI0039E170AA